MAQIAQHRHQFPERLNRLPVYHFTPWLKSGAIPLYYATFKLCGFQDLVEHLTVNDPKHVNAKGNYCLTPLVAALAAGYFQTADFSVTMAHIGMPGDMRTRHCILQLGRPPNSDRSSKATTFRPRPGPDESTMTDSRSSFLRLLRSSLSMVRNTEADRCHWIERALYTSERRCNEEEKGT